MLQVKSIHQHEHRGLQQSVTGVSSNCRHFPAVVMLSARLRSSTARKLHMQAAWEPAERAKLQVHSEITALCPRRHSLPAGPAACRWLALQRCCQRLPRLSPSRLQIPRRRRRRTPPPPERARSAPAAGCDRWAAPCSAGRAPPPRRSVAAAPPPAAAGTLPPGNASGTSLSRDQSKDGVVVASTMARGTESRARRCSTAAGRSRHPTA